MSITTTTTPTTAVVPTCPSWCTTHLFAAMDDKPRWIHRHQTSEQDAPFVVQVEQDQGEPATVYVQDSRGDDLTSQQARAFALALVAAADLVDAVQG